MSPIVSDIVCTTDGGATKWQAIYTILDDEEPEVVEVKAIIDDARPSNLQFKDIACSFFHRIAARATLLPYTDMIRWLLDSSIIKDRQLITAKNDILVSFRAKYLKVMYKLPDQQDIYDNGFVENFTKNNEDPFKTIQGWRKLDNKFKHEKSSMYPIDRLTGKSLQFCSRDAMQIIWSP